jgi:hypothetical protein
MSQHFFERPILNSSYGFPGRHCELDAEGQPTNRISCGSRSRARPTGSQVLGPYNRTNVCGSDFSSLYLKQDASRYLSQLQSVADDLDRSGAWIGQFPPFDAVPTPVPGVNAKTSRSIIAGIQRSEAIEVKSRFLSRPEPRWRWIAPHAIGFNGFWWYAGTFRLRDQTPEYSPPSLITETHRTLPSEVKPPKDVE